MLSADHGVTTMPEATLVPASRPWCADAKKDRWERTCGSVGRLFPAAVAKGLDRVATKATGVPGMIDGIADPYVYFTHTAHALPAPKRRALVAAVRAALSKNALVGKGSRHGSPLLFDRAVLARARGRIDAARTIEDTVGFQVFARTACDLLEVPFALRGSRETLVTR